MLGQFSFRIALGLGAMLLIAATWRKPRQRPFGIVAAILPVAGG